MTLGCPVSANPAATAVVWYKDNAQLTVTGRYSGGTLSTPDLTISGLSGSDTGRYFCRVTNSLGTTDSSNINVDVQCKCLFLRVAAAIGNFRLARTHTHTHARMHVRIHKTKDRSICSLR